MPVLKRQSSRQVLKGAVVLDMADLDRQGKQILAQAKEEAASLLAAARAEAESQSAKAAEAGRTEGREQGIAEGRDAGREEGRRQIIEELQPRLDQMLQAWSNALEQWEKDRAEMLLAARQDVLAFALEMGRKITLRTIEVDPTVVADQVAEALAHLVKPTRVMIAIHPDDRPLVEEVLPNLVSRFENCTHATLREEATIPRGGCIVSTGSGKIDASIDTQIEGIVTSLLPNGTRGEQSHGDGAQPTD